MVFHMKHLTLFVILIFSCISILPDACAKQSSNKTHLQKKTKKNTRLSYKKYKNKGRYKKSKSGLDLVQLTTKSPFDDKLDSPENGVNKIENEPGL